VAEVEVKVCEAFWRLTGEKRPAEERIS